MTNPRVLSIGQCMADHASLARAFQQAFAAEVVPADSEEEAISLLGAGTYALILVNRVFDANGSSGLDCIKHIKKDPALAATPVMLVSNFADAQTQAVQAGALPGFGKAGLGQPAMLERVGPFLK